MIEFSLNCTCLRKSNHGHHKTQKTCVAKHAQNKTVEKNTCTELLFQNIVCKKVKTNRSWLENKQAIQLNEQTKNVLSGDITPIPT